MVLSFSNGEPGHAQSIASQRLGAASRRRGRHRDRSSAADRARVRSAVDSPILNQAVRILLVTIVTCPMGIDSRCPKRVKNGHRDLTARCPLLP
jgi:hypothetical protein